MLSEWQLIAGVAIFLISILLRIPIPFSFGLAGIYYFFQLDIPLTALPQRAVATADSFTLMSIPMFMFVGILMTSGPMAMRLLNFAKALVGHLTGGLAQVNVAASMLFAGMSGSSSADAAGLGAVEIPLMTESGYTARYAAAVTGASACLGALIPPSIPLIIYGGLAQVSVGRLFIASAVPGVLLGLIFMMLVRFTAREHLADKSKFSFGTLWLATKAAIPELFMPVILVGGILTGVFTPAEAAGVATAYGLLLVAIRRELTRGELMRVFYDTIKYTGIFMLIVMLASAFGWILIREQVGGLIFSAELGGEKSIWAIWAIIIVGVLLIGCFMETISALALIVPVVAPIAAVTGIDPVQLGVVVVFGLQVGLITPPVGMAMYIVCAIAHISVWDFTRTVMPFMLVMIALLVILAGVPWLSLALPDFVFSRM